MNSSSQIVYEDRNTTVGLGEVIRFKIPASVPLIDTQNTFLKFNLQVGNGAVQDGWTSGDQADENHYVPWTLNKKTGCANIIKNLTIKSQSGEILEQITDYNRLNRVVCQFVKNETQDNLTRLYSGGDDDYVGAVNTLTSRTANDDTKTQENKVVECLMQFNLSGLLNNPMPFPNMLVNGLEIEILLEDDGLKVVHAQGNELGQDNANFIDKKDYQCVVGGYSQNTPYCADGAMAITNPAGTVASFFIKQINATGANAGANFYNDATDVNDVLSFPFFNGQELLLENSLGNPVSIVVTKVNYNNGIQIFTKSALNLNGNTTVDGKIWINVDAKAAPKITLSDMQLVVGVVNPDPKQLNAMESMVRGKGYVYNFKSFQDFPVNNQAGSLRNSNLINCRYKRCKAILSFWENVGDASTVDKDNLNPQVLTTLAPSSYQYKIDGLLVPNRKVELQQYVKDRTKQGGWSGIHIKEIEQAIGCCGLQVKDLTDIDCALCFGRGLVPVGSGAYYDMSSNEETRLEIAYTAQAKSLLQHNFVCNLKSLVIQGNNRFIDE
jgi:hypothetical protein